jgi:molybdate/tungstate transport system substrate-binding protein
MPTTHTRRELLAYSRSLLAAAIAAGIPTHLLAQTLATLDVASAGSMRSMLEGPIKTAIAPRLHLDLHAHSGGADATAQSIVTGALHADIFIPITAHPMRTVFAAGLAQTAQPIARTELVLVYSPKSKFLPQFQAAATGKANWWQVLQQPGIRIGRGNPAADPGARCTIFALMLAEKKYNLPGLAEKILGPTLNPEQIIPGVRAGLQSGVIDATTSYKTGAIASKLPYISLPADINLKSLTLRVDHPNISLTIGSQAFYPEPLVFYAAQLKNAANPTGAAAFLRWLQTPESQSLFRQNQFNPPSEAPLLTSTR